MTLIFYWDCLPHTLHYKNCVLGPHVVVFFFCGLWLIDLTNTNVDCRTLQNMGQVMILTLKMLNCLKITKDIFTFLVISFILFNRRRPDLQWNSPICCLSCSQCHSCWCRGDLRSLGINRNGIDQISRSIPSLASRELIHSQLMNYPQQEEKRQTVKAVCKFMWHILHMSFLHVNQCHNPEEYR